MKSSWSYLEELSHGALLGGLIGILAGYVEYLLFFYTTTYPGDLTQAYWETVIPYAILGFISCAVLILFSKLVGLFLKAKENYYDK